MNYQDFKFRMDKPEIENIISIDKIAAIFRINYNRAPKDLKIVIIDNGNGYFTGIANYSFWGPSQGDPYKSVHTTGSIHQALQDALEGIIEFDDNSFPNNVVFWESDCGKLIDGDGQNVSLAEANMRRNNYRI